VAYVKHKPNKILLVKIPGQKYAKNHGVFHKLWKLAYVKHKPKKILLVEIPGQKYAKNHGVFHNEARNNLKSSTKNKSYMYW